MAIGIHHADHVALALLTSGGRSVGIVQLWTQAMEFSFFRKFMMLSSALVYVLAFEILPTE
jgi:hypothetical protein